MMKHNGFFNGVSNCTDGFVWCKLKTRQSWLVVVAVALSTLTFGAQANEFWANKLGGGPGDVLQRNILYSKYQEQSTTARVDARTDGTYLIHADSKATVHAYKNTPIGNITNFDTKIGAIRSQNKNGGSTLQISQGLWTSQPTVTSNSEIESLPPLVIDHSESEYAVVVSMSETATATGTDVYLSARVSDNVDNESGDVLQGPTHRVTNGTASVLLKDAEGRESQWPLSDDGSQRQGDENSGDSIYSGKVPLQGSGIHEVIINFMGTVDGRVVHRTSTMNITIGENRLTHSNKSILATKGEVLGDVLEEGRYGIPINVNLAQGEFPDIIKTRAEIWAKESNGNDILVGWTGGLVKPTVIDDKTRAVPLTFHSGWLDQGVRFFPPLSIRNIELNDIDTGDQMLHTSSPIEIQGIPFPEYDAHRSGKLEGRTTIDMQQGVHPSLLGADGDRAAAETRVFPGDPGVLTLHGWCSPRMSSALFGERVGDKILNFDLRLASFPDVVNGGESADRYAVYVMNSLQFIPGSLRGIVAHSQGGLVAATLLEFFPYIFADSAQSRPPNVISIGSPYNGATLLDINLGLLLGLDFDFLNELGDFWGFRWAASGLTGTFLDCEIPPELFPATNYRWAADIGWRARNQIRAFITVHPGTTDDDSLSNCGSYSIPNVPLSFTPSIYIPGLDDGVISIPDGANFADGGLQLEIGCHVNLAPHQWQWNNPDFITAVDETFDATYENWVPF